jgi:hypothetical protein
MPLVTNQQIRTALTSLTTSTQGGSHLEVFFEFPSDEGKISEGFYVARVYEADRKRASMGLNPNSHIYTVEDRIEMYMITQQVNPFVDGLLAIFPALLDNSIFNGYHIREHSIEQLYVNNSERYRIVFDLTRIQVI